MCLPKRFCFSEEQGDDEHTERGRRLLRQEQVLKHGLKSQDCVCLRPIAVRSCTAHFGVVKALQNGFGKAACAPGIQSRLSVLACCLPHRMNDGV